MNFTEVRNEIKRFSNSEAQTGTKEEITTILLGGNGFIMRCQNN